jgi:hypothetical protein
MTSEYSPGSRRQRVRVVLGVVVLGVLTMGTTSVAGKKDSVPNVELPAAPSGFTWKTIPEIKAAFLMPDGWFYKRVKKGDTLAYFLTAQDIDEAGSFDTGLSINVFRKRKGQDSVTYAKQFIAGLGQRHELLRSWETEMGDLHGFGCQVRAAANATSPATRMHYLAVACKPTNTLYVMFFEAPDAAWESAWAKGDVMLKIFVLDNEV